jgi:hypothetical protein
MANGVNANLKEIGIGGKIFCLSMQRSGTSSVGDFLEQWGYKRAGHPLSRSKNWTRHWLNGNYDAIFNDPVFAEHEVFEDDPWWCPEFYKYVFHKVPDSRFILLTRDSDSWFKSMIHHSRGYTLGFTDVHAKIYRREDDLRWLEQNVKDYDGSAPQGMTLFDKAAHYKAVYDRHTAEIGDFFAKFAPGALFQRPLKDPELWADMARWLRLPERAGIVMSSHAHKTRKEFTVKDLLGLGGK